MTAATNALTEFGLRRCSSHTPTDGSRPYGPHWVIADPTAPPAQRRRGLTEGRGWEIPNHGTIRERTAAIGIAAIVLLFCIGQFVEFWLTLLLVAAAAWAARWVWDRRWPCAPIRRLPCDEELISVLDRGVALRPRWDDQTVEHVSLAINEVMWNAADQGYDRGFTHRAAAALDDLFTDVSDLAEPDTFTPVVKAKAWAKARRDALKDLDDGSVPG